MRTKLVFNTFLAKRLLNEGNSIIDLLKDYSRRDGVICVFERTKKFEYDFDRLSKELSNKTKKSFTQKKRY